MSQLYSAALIGHWVAHLGMGILFCLAAKRSGRRWLLVPAVLLLLWPAAFTLVNHLNNVYLADVAAGRPPRFYPYSRLTFGTPGPGQVGFPTYFFWFETTLTLLGDGLRAGAAVAVRT